MLRKNFVKTFSKTLKNNNEYLLFREYSKPSYLKGEKVETIEKTIGNYFSLQSKNTPYSNILRSNHQRILWSNLSLKKHVDALACGLLEQGLRPGDRLGFIQGNNAEQIVTVLACAKIGAILVEFRNIKNEKDLNRYMELFRPRVVMLPSKFKKVNYWNILYDLVPELSRTQMGVPVKSKRFPFCKSFILTDANLDSRTGILLYKESFVYGPFGFYENPIRRVTPQIKPQDPVLILLDSDNIEKAKPVVYSHQNLLNAGKVLGEILEITQNDRVMVPSNQYSPFASILGNFSSLVHGATLTLPCEEFNAQEVLKVASQDQINVLFGETNEFKQLLNHPDLTKYDYSSLRSLVVDSNASIDMINDLKDKFNAEVFQIQGTNETCGLLQVNDKIIPNVECKIIRPKDGKILESDTNGWLKAKGPTITPKVWRDIGMLQENFDEDLFLYTGKLALMDKTGKLQLQ